MKCMSRTYFITLDKSDYRDALYEIERKNRIEKVNFIKGLPIFSKLSRTYLTKFASNIKTMTCNKHQVLYRQGDPVERVYIIREGEFEISKKLQEKETDVVNDTSEELRQLLKHENLLEHEVQVRAQAPRETNWRSNARRGAERPGPPLGRAGQSVSARGLRQRNMGVQWDRCRHLLR